MITTPIINCDWQGIIFPAPGRVQIEFGRINRLASCLASHGVRIRFFLNFQSLTLTQRLWVRVAQRTDLWIRQKGAKTSCTGVADGQLITQRIVTGHKNRWQMGKSYFSLWVHSLSEDTIGCCCVWMQQSFFRDALGRYWSRSFYPITIVIIVDSSWGWPWAPVELSASHSPQKLIALEWWSMGSSGQSGQSRSRVAILSLEVSILA